MEIIADYTGIVDIAKHCDKAKLAIAENNALEYDIPQVLCDLKCYFDEFQEEVPMDDEVFIGGSIGYFNFGGLNKILALFSYANYVENSIYIDTGSGFVRKDHGNSMPVMHNDLKDISVQHRSMAKEEVLRLLAYACKSSKCKCICAGDLCGKAGYNTRLSRSRGRNVSRR